MKTVDAVEYFGTKAAVARALGISSAAVAQWGEIVPLTSALLLERISNGALVVDFSDYPRLDTGSMRA